MTFSSFPGAGLNMSEHIAYLLNLNGRARVGRGGGGRGGFAFSIQVAG